MNRAWQKQTTSCFANVRVQQSGCRSGTQLRQTSNKKPHDRLRFLSRPGCTSVAEADPLMQLAAGLKACSTLLSSQSLNRKVTRRVLTKGLLDTQTPAYPNCP